MNKHNTINYLELPAHNFNKTKRFFKQVFGWQFVDYGPDYMAFENAGIDGGFYRSSLSSRTESGSVLIVFYSSNLTETLSHVEAAGGMIVKPIFSFPGGRRFHFQDPNGNELAVWSET